MPSFDTVCEPNMVEVKNAVENAAKEIGTRFDFKGTSAAIELKEKEITLFGDADFQLHAGGGHPVGKLTKRNVDVRFLDKGDVQKIGGDKVKQVHQGAQRHREPSRPRRSSSLIKDSKLKVQAAIQGDAVRITGAKRDDLQAAMALIRKEMRRLPAVLQQLPRLMRARSLAAPLRAAGRCPARAASPARQSVALQGMLGSKALLIVDGARTQTAWRRGETHKGVKVLSTLGDQAVVEIDGKRHTLRVGDAPASVGGPAARRAAAARSS